MVIYRVKDNLTGKDTSSYFHVIDVSVPLLKQSHRPRDQISL